jgi:adenine-specific DNA-methyltransferase
MQLNAEDCGNRKFIMVQLPEKCEEKSEAYKAGYKTICEIGQERIRRAGKKIIEETGKNIDIGFRVFKLDSSNMNDVYYNPTAFNQSMLDMTVDNVKADRTPLDLLFQVMLDLGVELSADIVEKTVNGKNIYAVNGNDLIACFDNDIDNDVITAIATEKPLYAVFKDKSFATDSVGINNEQLFKTYSPSTVVKVL